MDMTTPAEIVKELELRARKETTPCGDGNMVWHIWGDGPSLVLMHGGYGSWTHWVKNIEALSQHFTVYTPDTPGLGDSAMPPEPVSPDSIGAIVSEGLNLLIPASETIKLAGFSFGGTIGSRVAVHQGARVTDLVIIGSGGMGIPRAPMEEMINWRDAPTPEAVREAQRRNLEILMISDPAKVDDLAIYTQTENTKRGRVKSIQFAVTARTLEALHKVDGKISGIWGEQDAIAVGNIDARREALRAVQPDCDFRVIPGAGHWVIYESPDTVNEMLLEILEVTPA
jgi:pimeloyl-ACP methyl ester carboxylesterase